jgi:hypothetical protein
VFPDDPLLLAHMGAGTEPGLSGEAVLVQACSQCHNARLDQNPLAMPPSRLRVLTPEARARNRGALALTRM